MEIAILHVHVALIAKYFTTDKHFTYYLLSSEGWHFRRAKINPWGRCPIIDLVLVLVLGLEGQVLVNITGESAFACYQQRRSAEFKVNKTRFRPVLAPDLAGRAHDALPDPRVR